MFGGSRRHRPPVQPLTKETANPNAATAAASAFMRREATTTSLSSAAAAAALKARPTTPTNVAEVQTKRTARRSPSVSSIGSREGGRALQRSHSVGSMSERSFRSPSPGRGLASQHQYVPPVPKLPTDNHVVAATRAAGNSASRKGPGLQTQPFRTASQKAKDGQSGSWFGAAKARNPADARKSDLALQTSFDSYDGRPGSISPSINFSYPRPRSSSIDSHNTPSPIADNAMVYDPNSRRMVPKADLSERQYAVREASEKPVKKKKAQEVSRSGSHLSKGTVGRTKAPALERPLSDKTEDVSRPETSTRIQPSKALPQQPLSRKETTLGNLEDADVTATEGIESHPSPPQTSSPGPLHFPTGLESLTPATAIPESSAVQPEAIPLRDPSLDGIEDPRNDDAISAVATPGITTIGAEADQKPAVHETMEDKGLVDEKPNAVAARKPTNVRRERVHSESPARTAHFAPATDQLVVRHEPPSRSLSPRKSALKHRSPTRDASPSDDSSEASGSGLGASLREDTPLGRRKSARVSFDDQNTVVVGEAAPRLGETDSPIVLSPQSQTKKPWHSIVGKNNRKEHLPLDEDETMSPRPALPLFGSVREKKAKEPEERPLVRPQERTWSPSPVSPAPRQPSPFNSPPPDLPKPSEFAESSSTQDQPARNAANISKYREPLPPVVTSVEGSGYISNSAESSDNEEEDDGARPVVLASGTQVISNSVEEAPVTQADPVTGLESETAFTETVPVTDSRPPNPGTNMSENQPIQQPVPNISISLPSPPPQEVQQAVITPQQEYFDVPGGFPEDDETAEEDAVHNLRSTDEPSDALASISNNTGEVSSKIAGPETPPLASVPNSEATTNDNTAYGPPMADIREEDELTDTSSIYSDAYEDLSDVDVDGDGFMSLDAVLTAPVPRKSFEKSPSKLTSKPAQVVSTAAVVPPTPVQASDDKPPHAPDDWENAKVYWRSLTTEKRRQLENEAMVDGSDEADTELEPKPKKKVRQRTANSSITEASPQQLGDGQSRSYQIQPGTKWPTNGSLNGYSESAKAARSPVKSDRSGGTKLRKSMRQDEPVLNVSSPQQGAMRKSLRSGGSGPTTGPPSKLSGRPISHQPLPTAELTKNHKRNASAEAQRSKPDPFASSVIRPNPRRRGSDESESSFTRTRAAFGEGFGFKKTMRNSVYEPAAAKPSPEHTKGSSRFSLRSLSPSGSAFRRSSMASSPPPVPGGRIRHSMRSESGDGGHSRMRIPTFSRSTDKKAKSKQDGSRFADSSDEEDRAPAFNSRFADSSDEDDNPVPLSKGQGLPKTMRNKSSSSAAAAAMGMPSVQRQDTNSPDIPDSDDEEVVQPKRRDTNGIANGKTGTTIQRSGSGRGHMIAANHTVAAETQAEAPIRPTQSRRGSFMSTILRRKKGPTGKISKGITESAARRDTPLERSTEELSMIRTGSNGKPRLQKQGPGWPFPDEVGQGNAAATATTSSKARPSTAGGPVESSPKTNHLRRRSASYNGHAAAAAATPDFADEDPVEPLEPAEPAEPLKKKKFGTLRKMFRLHD